MNAIKKYDKFLEENGKSYIVISGKKYELDQGETFDPNVIVQWIELTKKLSNRKQKMRIPNLSAIRAVGLDENSINTFLNNEGKAGLVAYLRKQDWYVERHPEIKTVFLKLLAHLGLFSDKKRNSREQIINTILSNYTMLEIHNIFGSLIPGTNLLYILKVYDETQKIDPAIRKKYDPTGEKGIKFFLDNIDNPEFKSIAYYALTHYVYEAYKLDMLKQNYIAQIESQSAKSSDINIQTIANEVNRLHLKIDEYIHLSKNDNSDKTKELQDNMESARKKLRQLIEMSSDEYLKRILAEYKRLPHTLTIEFIKQDLETPKLDFVKDEKLRQLLLDAGYKDADEIEINTILKIYEKGKTAPKKYFAENVIDNNYGNYKYIWLYPNNPLLYSIAMKCGGTCMRPGFAGEAALWESSLSPDVCLCAILDKENQPIGYMRVNYDLKNHGIYIDTIESRKSTFSNNDEVWQIFKTALLDMAGEMNKIGKYPVDVINYRYDLGNQLNEQFEGLENTTKYLDARPYSYKEAPWIYGDSEIRMQKKIWVREKTNVIINKINTENELSKGATGIVYAINDYEVIKLYPEGYDLHRVEEEFYKGRIIYDAGIKCPRPFEITNVDNQYGIILERIKGNTLTRQIASNPHDTEILIKKMVEMMKNIHRIDANNLGLQSLKSKYLNALAGCKEYYNDEEFSKLIALVRAIPDRKTLLHGDFHTGNIILNESNELVILDFLELGYGHPIFDIMAQGAVIPVTIENDPNLAESYHQTTIGILNRIWDSFIKEYFAPPTPEELFEFSKDAALYSRIRNAITKTIAEKIPEEYLQLCADKTKEILLPETDRLINDDKILNQIKKDKIKRLE